MLATSRSGKWRTAGVGGGGRNFEVSGEYLEIAPPRLLVTTWLATWTGDVETTVGWELEPTSAGTLVRLNHSGPAPPSKLAELAQNYRGWPSMLGRLQAFAEAGKTVADARDLGVGEPPALRSACLQVGI